LAGLSVLGACGVPTPGDGAEPNKQIAASAGEEACGDAQSFYASEPDTRIWVKGGKLSPKGTELVAALKGVDAAAPPVNEQTMSTAFVRHASRLAAAPAGRPIVYVEPAVQPQRPCASRLLALAAQSPRLRPVLQRLGAPNIIAQAIGRAHQDAGAGSGGGGLATDLALARSFGPLRRAIVVDTNSAQLWAIDGNRVAETMKVIVGKRGSETPEMAAVMRYAKLNPYWDIPPDLVKMRIAAQVVERGPKFLQERGYVAVDRYGEAPNLLSPAAVDWAAVREGTIKVGVRQVPGADNMLGRVLFMFPNRLGIYLHDTPHRSTFALADRHISNGCVRLERAAALYRWSFGEDLPPSQAAGPDQRMDLPEPIPVFLVRFSSAGARALSGLSPNSRT
jgi:lipoprotein-anchoring transpeptidase ErfK/SrfK